MGVSATPAGGASSRSVRGARPETAGGGVGDGARPGRLPLGAAPHSVPGFGLGQRRPPLPPAVIVIPGTVTAAFTNAGAGGGRRRPRCGVGWGTRWSGGGRGESDRTRADASGR